MKLKLLFVGLCALVGTIKCINNVRIITFLVFISLFYDVRAQLLKGVVKTNDIVPVVISYTLDGVNTQIQTINPANDGSFLFNIDNVPELGFNVEICVNESRFGAYVENEKTTSLCIVPDEKGKLQIVFDGDNQDVCQFFNRFAIVSDPFRYVYIPSFSEQKLTSDESIVLLDNDYNELKKLLSDIKSDELRCFCEKLSINTYMGLKGKIYELEAEKTGKVLKEITEYMDLANNVINPNEPMNYRTGLIYIWINVQQTHGFKFGEDMTAYFLERMDIIDKYITHPIIHRKLTVDVATICFSKKVGAISNIDKLWIRFQKMAEAYPDLIVSCKPTY